MAKKNVSADCIRRVKKHSLFSWRVKTWLSRPRKPSRHKYWSKKSGSPATDARMEVRSWPRAFLGNSSSCSWGGELAPRDPGRVCRKEKQRQATKISRHGDKSVVDRAHARTHLLIECLALKTFDYHRLRLIVEGPPLSTTRRGAAAEARAGVRLTCSNEYILGLSI